MALATATFKTIEVRLFLDRQYPYAASCFAQAFRDETVKSSEVEEWFKRYFPAGRAFTTFRQLEANVAQSIDIPSWKH